MNNDDFTAAAREEARLYWLETLQDETVGIGNLGQHMAEWARAHLAAQEPTDAEVEAAARIIFNRARAGNAFADAVWFEVRGDYLEDARAALSAARNARYGTP